MLDADRDDKGGGGGGMDKMNSDRMILLVVSPRSIFFIKLNSTNAILIIERIKLSRNLNQ